MKKSVLIFAAVLLTATCAFANSNGPVTAGGGIGIGGIYNSSEAKLKKNDSPIDLTMAGADIFDAEGRCFFNRNNIALMIGVGGSVGVFKDSQTKDMFEAAPSIMTLTGAGYRIPVTSNSFFVPSFVIGSNQINAEDEVSNSETIYIDYTAYCAGADFAYFYRLTDKMHLQLSGTVLCSLASNGTYKHETGSVTTKNDLKSKGGDIYSKARIGLIWLF